jgi:hypothetical protein
VPPSSHVFIVVEENHSHSSVIGSSSMPYLNSLANQYGMATRYFADTHPSIGNYFMLTTGQIVTNDDNFSGTVSVDNLVRHLVSAGKTWKFYAESLPSVGYTGGDVYRLGQDGVEAALEMSRRGGASKLTRQCRFVSGWSATLILEFLPVCPSSAIRGLRASVEFLAR